ncbi:hypothetical protein [Limosilactobacillus reuteri]|uniref:hypothetical protein n=1 Tax=Limosilactobacillus reuteri TaxID=1598 RepID=UPI001E2C8260|nr:hypothetical protein [Limosilactobacillus reuteri]MCC4440003.1 hypothetical protein [Limosilactobacillus reuteri]
MSRELLNVNNTDTIKQNDDSTTIILSAHDDNEPKIFKAGDVGTIHISTSQYHIPSIPAKLVVGSNNVNINSADLVNLPAGKYSLELWVSQKDGPHTTIYPSSGSLALTIDKNSDDLTDKTLTTLTLDDLRKDLHDDVNDAVKHIKVDPSMLDLSDYAKKTDVPSVVYDSSKKQLTINGVNVDLPDNVDLSDYVRKEDTANFAKKTDIPTVPVITLDTAKRTLTVNNNVINIPESVDLTGYVKTGDLANYALKSDIPAAPDLSEYAKKSDIKTVDLTQYIKTVDADAKYATKAAVENIKSQKGDRGTMIYLTNAQLSSKNMNMSVSIASLNQTTPTPRAGDYLIANIDTQTAISTITKVDSSDVYISSSYVNLQGVAGHAGSNGHSIWACQGSSSDISINASQLLNYQQYSMLQPEIGDLVVGSDGTISSITYSYGDPLVINTGSVLATIKAQSENTVPTNSTFDYSKYPNLPIISQENLGYYLGLDSTKSYTLNVDDNTLYDGTNTTQKALKPGIYLLRDFQNHGYNLTIKSDQAYGLAYGTLVQLIVTPYMLFAVVVGPNSAETLCARTQWDHDSYGYYGVSNKWFVVGQENKTTN